MSGPARTAFLTVDYVEIICVHLLYNAFVDAVSNIPYRFGKVGALAQVQISLCVDKIVGSAGKA